MLAKFACANPAVKFSAVNLLNSGLVIYLLRSGILFSTAVRAVAVANFVILFILLLTSFILASRAVVAAKLMIAIPILTLALRVELVAMLVISGVLFFILAFFYLQCFLS